MERLGFRLGGLALRLAAWITSARVTSWFRSKEKNKEVGGHPESRHLIGGAVDLGKETAEDTVKLFKRLGRGSMHRVGTPSEHWHFEGDWVTVGRYSKILLGVLMGFGRMKERK